MTAPIRATNVFHGEPIRPDVNIRNAGRPPRLVITHRVGNFGLPRARRHFRAHPIRFAFGAVFFVAIAAILLLALLL